MKKREYHQIDAIGKLVGVLRNRINSHTNIEKVFEKPDLLILSDLVGLLQNMTKNNTEAFLHINIKLDGSPLDLTFPDRKLEEKFV